MSTWNLDDKVALRRRPEFVGTVTDEEKRGTVGVTFDGGGRGWFLVGELQAAADAPVTNATWPPSNYETKLLPG